MDALTSQIAGLRLAPIQCAPGASDNTGLATVDYFISSELMEPEDADAHYSETLVRLSGIACASAALPVHATESSQGVRTPEDAVIYLSPQSLFKYLPQYDCVPTVIAARYPKRYCLCGKWCARNH